MKKKIIIAVCAVLVVIVSALALVGCGNKELVGFDIELAKAVAEDLGIEVKFTEIEWNNKESEIASKKIDVIWNGVTITDERKAAWSISEPYMNNNQVAVIRKEDSAKYTDKASLANGKVTFETGSAGAEVADEIQTDSSKKVGAVAQIDTLTELNAKTADIAIIDSVMARYYLSKADGGFSENLMIVPNLVLAEEQYGIAFRKGSILCDKINGSLSKLFANGTIKTIAEKYGLEADLVPFNYTAKADADMTAEETAEWNGYKDKGIKIGYTLYAPIAYKVDKAK